MRTDVRLFYNANLLQLNLFNVAIIVKKSKRLVVDVYIYISNEKAKTILFNMLNNLLDVSSFERHHQRSEMNKKYNEYIYFYSIGSTYKIRRNRSWIHQIIQKIIKRLKKIEHKNTYQVK